ncbi:hypothetical protein LINPERPRIM_LOCUS40999 [Linum perenne]
MEVDH